MLQLRTPSVARARALLLLLALCPLLSHAAEKLATLNYRLLPEASGLAVSRIDEKRLWLLNDSGNRAELIAYNTRDASYSVVKVSKQKNKDWEDLAAFTYRGQPWLAIGDVGDNDARRKSVKVHLLPEPPSGSSKVSVYATLRLTYPKGPRDVESIAVDAQGQRLYLLSKRDKYPRLYRVDIPELEEGREYEIEAERMGKIRSIPKPDDDEIARFKHGKYRAQPTAMEAFPDGSAIALMTYRGAYLARLGEEGDWIDALNNSLCPIATPTLKQAETIAVDGEGGLYVTSEGKGAPLLRFDATCVNDGS